MIDYHVKFITCNETVSTINSDVKSFKYETKKRSDETIFDLGKRDYYVRRGGHWRSSHPRHLKRLETKLRDKAVVKSIWITDTLILLVFSSGAIVYLTVKLQSLDVTHILFDSYLVGKLSGQLVTNVALTKSHMLFTHNDRSATLVSFGKNASTIPSRITDRDPSLHSIEVGGARRADKNLSSCDTQTGSRVLVWSAGAAEPAPWSPVGAVEDLANLHLYQINGNNISLVAYHQLENETLCAELSQNQDNVIHIVEQIACPKNGVSIEWTRYDIPSCAHASPLSPREGARAALPAAARLARLAPDSHRLLAACIDQTLHILHHTAGLTRSINAGFIATDVRWVDELIVVAEEAGRLQCYDRALSLIHHHTKCFDLTPHTRDGRRMQVLCTSCSRGASTVLTSFDGGPLAIVRLSHPRLLTSWIRTQRMWNAVELLRAMDWEVEGTECLWAVSKLVCAALRNGAEALTSEWYAQGALGSFLAPPSPHSVAAMRFAPPVHDLARKLYHHLLRRGRIEKALSLGVDLAAWDLFADARWAAADRRLPALADEAAALAHRYSYRRDSECSDTCSESDCSSCSYANDAETSTSSETKTIPPPLPRVSLLPTLLPVPMTPPEPTSANSIRPNLHQYLERDNTIWNMDHDNLKPILTAQSSKWHENGLPYKHEPTKNLDLIPKNRDRFKHVFQTELREETPNTLYRYQNFPNKERYRIDGTDRQRPEKSKVKFSDTVTIAVVSEPHPLLPSPARELADSLPLCPPHKYLSAFTPHAGPPAGTVLDYVEV